MTVLQRAAELFGLSIVAPLAVVAVVMAAIILGEMAKRRRWWP